MKKIKFTSAFFIILASMFYIGCGDDSTGPVDPGAGSGYHPNLVFTVGQQFVYTTDSLPPTGPPIRKRWSSTNTILAQTTYQGELCYPITGQTRDSSTNPHTITPEAYWFRYDQPTGRFYQYGIRQMINISQPGSWDLVGDFDVARGTSYFIGDINYSLVIPGIGNVTFTGPLNGAITDSTSITTTGNPPQSIPCYKITMTATVSGTGGVSATIILDYYLGYSAPTGIVELKLNPFTFFLGSTPVFPSTRF